MTEANASSQRKTWLIVGASRGIGKEFVEQLLERGDKVYATTRGAVQYHDGRNPVILKCDVTDEGSIENCLLDLERQCDKIDYVVLNAGVLKYPNRATEMSYTDFQFHLQTNTIGPILTAQALLKSSIAIGNLTFISSDSGSAQNFRGFEDGFAAYASSKAALNQALRHMAAELKRKGSKTTVLALHPGEVATDMAKSVEVGWEIEAKILNVDESVSACIKVIEGKGVEGSGTFWTWEDKQYPW